MRKVAQLLISILLLQTISGLAQEKSFIIPDSLRALSYEELSAKFYKVLRTNDEHASLYAKAYLQKGKDEKKPIETAIGYSFIGYTFNEKTHLKEQLIFLDSAINVCKGLNHQRYPLFFYIAKGASYEDNGNFKKALDNFLYAVELAKNVKNRHLEVVSNHNIALVKRKLGKYKEAKSILQKCLDYEEARLLDKDQDPSPYLLTLSELVNIYRLNSQIDSAYTLNNKGLKMSKGTLSESLFELNEGILQYYRREYRKAIDKIETSIPNKEKLSYFYEDYNLINALLYLGKSHEEISDKEKATYYFKKIDSIAETINYIVPETKSAYLGLINHYKSLGNKNQQLFYINRLLYSDSILNNNYRYLSDKLNKDYDTPELLRAKEALIADLEEKHNSSSLSVIVLSIILGIGGIFLVVFYRKQKRYQQRFEELINAQDKEVESEKTLVPKETSKAIGISEDIVNSILKSLDEFEHTQGYIEANITTSSLASQFKTNSKYLSKVINTYKQKSFIHYTNDLRIEFIIDKLKNENKYRLYTIKALASEAGFNTTEAFSKSFYKKTGIYPSYFIKQLEKKEESQK
ncbi:AraC family transcriptional regulator [Aquimarina aggregata]|uniref:AraC family transcriptional regulator n=1 Tax=Aquimarina aggregata TaxID=1642818 RepID=UPI0024907845|nr:AraC family transcriptional regulator [Aquimarina aggregata]